MESALSTIGLSTADATPVWFALILGLAAAGATLIGWLLAAVRRDWPPAVQGAVLGLAAVAMIALTLTEIIPSALQTGVHHGLLLAALLGGFALVVVLGRLTDRLAFRGSPLVRTGLVVALAIGLHNIPEGGIAVGLSTISVGAALTAAFVIAAHNIPEGLAVAAPVLAAGGTRTRALVFVLLATAGEVAGVLLAAQFVTALAGTGIAVVLALVGGVMLAVSSVELLPAGVALVRQSAKTATTATTAPAYTS